MGLYPLFWTQGFLLSRCPHVVDTVWDKKKNKKSQVAYPNIQQEKASEGVPFLPVTKETDMKLQQELLVEALLVLLLEPLLLWVQVEHLLLCVQVELLLSQLLEPLLALLMEPHVLLVVHMECLLSLLLWMLVENLQTLTWPSSHRLLEQDS